MNATCSRDGRLFDQSQQAEDVLTQPSANDSDGKSQMTNQSARAMTGISS